MPLNPYDDEAVSSRLVEFLGGTTPANATAVFVTANGRSPHVWYDPRPTTDLWQLVHSGGEIARSLWDRESLIAHLDIEYVNFDDPAEPYVHRPRTFALQRPVVRAVEEMLVDHGVAPLHLLSGRGHHFVWRVAHDSDAFIELADLGRVSPTLMGKYAQPQPPHGMHIPPNLGRAFAGMGQVLEFVAHRVLKAAATSCQVPIQLTAVEVGPIARGREIISIDLSEYGDPLFTRNTRMPFSTYLKPLHAPRFDDKGVSRYLSPLSMIPLHEMDEDEAIYVMQDREAVADLARRASVHIPEQSAGTVRLVASYHRSRLARFHSDFYMAEHDAPEAWPSGYDRTPLETLPLCVSRILRQPNDLLLKPAGMQHVVRTLLGADWSPRHIGGLIRSKFERNFGWGPTWYVYDAATRADFYVRLFAGLLADGLDELVDFNCRSTLEKGYCCATYCGEVLERCRQACAGRAAVMQAAFGPEILDACGLPGSDKSTARALRRQAAAVKKSR
jgi:hypothetical protein